MIVALEEPPAAPAAEEHEEGFRIAEDDLLDLSIGLVKDALQLDPETFPPEALGIVPAPVYLGGVDLYFSCGDPARLRELLRRLWQLRKFSIGEERRATPAELAKIICDLNPDTAVFPQESERWNGAMAKLMSSDLMKLVIDMPLVVPVRGRERAVVERRIEWLLDQLRPTGEGAL